MAAKRTIESVWHAATRSLQAGPKWHWRVATCDVVGIWGES
jgi:hypothetical protein